MSVLEQTAERLADEVLAAVKKTGDATIIEKISKSVGDTSSTLQEAYMTVIRIKLAADRGDKMLADILAGEEVDNLDNPNL